MFKLIKMLSSIFVLLFIANSASANLITNGDFEASDVRQNSWRWFPSANVDGWQGSNVEVWDRFLGVNAQSGVQFAELNAHAGGSAGYSIFQTVDTEVGGIYDLSFAYRARRNDDEAFSLSIKNGAQSVFEQIFDDHTRHQWSLFETQFQAIDLSTTFTFSAITPRTGTVGNFIDNIMLEQVGTSTLRTQRNAIPEPATGLLIALCGLLFLRQRRKN